MSSKPRIDSLLHSAAKIRQLPTPLQESFRNNPAFRLVGLKNWGRNRVESSRQCSGCPDEAGVGQSENNPEQQAYHQPAPITADVGPAESEDSYDAAHGATTIVQSFAGRSQRWTKRPWCDGHLIGLISPPIGPLSGTKPFAVPADVFPCRKTMASGSH